MSDSYYFVHQTLDGNGSITVRVTSMTGLITYPPSHPNAIVPGVVPWAKAGVIMGRGTRQGSAYAAVMVTGSHGVRMQVDYTHNLAGLPGAVSAASPRWLRLTRSGDTLTGYQSADGTHWARIGTVTVAGLPMTVQAGLFVASPSYDFVTPVSAGDPRATSPTPPPSSITSACRTTRPAAPGRAAASVASPTARRWARADSRSPAGGSPSPGRETSRR